MPKFSGECTVTAVNNVMVAVVLMVIFNHLSNKEKHTSHGDIRIYKVNILAVESFSSWCTVVKI